MIVPARLAGGNRQRAGGGLVVAAGRGGAVGGGVVDRYVLAARGRKADREHEGGRAAVAFRQRHVGDDQRGQRGLGLTLNGTDVDGTAQDPREARAALVVGRGAGVVASVEGGAAGEEAHRLRRAAVVLERAEPRIDVEQVGGREAAAAGRVADQVMAERGDVTGEIGIIVRAVVGNDRIVQLELASVVVNRDSTAISGPLITRVAVPTDGPIAGDGAVVDERRSANE